MPYPISSTTYNLPFDGKIRVSSKRRYILVRWLSDPNGNPDAKPYIVLRSDSRGTLEKEYEARFDFIIDQAENTVTYHFNGHKEVSRG